MRVHWETIRTECGWTLTGLHGKLSLWALGVQMERKWLISPSEITIHGFNTFLHGARRNTRMVKKSTAHRHTLPIAMLRCSSHSKAMPLDCTVPSTAPFQPALTGRIPRPSRLRIMLRPINSFCTTQMASVEGLIR